MKSYFRLLLGFLFLITTIAGVVWLGLRQQNDSNRNTRLTIAATIFPIADIAQHVAGDDVNVLLILPPGTSEHAYTPTPQQLQAVQEAVVLFAVGQGLDFWATDPISRIATRPIVTVGQDIELRPFEASEEQEEEHGHDHEEGSVDPHYWLTVPNAQKIAVTIATKLQELDPEHTEDYQQNLNQYLHELEALETELQTLSSATLQKNFIAMHNAWNYLATHYGFNLVATYEPVEGREPSIADLNRLRNVIERYDIKVFFSEPQKKSIGALRLLEHDFGLEIRELDPIGGFAPYDSYINLMRTNIQALSR